MPRPTQDDLRRETRVEVGSTAETRPAPSSTPVDAGERDAEELTHESFSAVLGSRLQGGRWQPAEEIRVQVILGEITLDFTRADLPPSGIVEIDAWAILGEIKLIVPDGAEVEVDGAPIAGSIEHTVRRKGVWESLRERVTGEREEESPPPRHQGDPPFFRIDGHAVFGSIRVEGR